VKYRFDSIFFLPCPLSLFSAVLQVHAGVREEGEKRSGDGVDGRRSGERGDANVRVPCPAEYGGAIPVKDAEMEQVMHRLCFNFDA
jgi:hypothetical protein